MIVIRTAEEMARALDSPLDPELKRHLTAHWQRLSEYEGYELSDLAEFVIAQAGDTVGELSTVCELRVGEGGEALTFALGPEVIEQHDSWVELTFIYSDDGFELVLFIEIGPETDRALLAMCRHYLDELAAE